MQVVICRTGKRRDFLIVCGLIAVLFAYCISAPFVVYAIRLGETSNKVIVIDAGHGGADGGVKGIKSGVEEKELNLKIAFYLGEMLSGCGYKVAYTRNNDVMHTFKGVTNNKKRADMYKRAEIINNVKPCAVISIHQNFYSLPTRRGAQVFFAKKNEKSKELAESVQAMLNSKLNAPENGRTYAPLCAEKYLLECSPYPSIIVECGFLSNYADEQSLLSTAYQMRLAAVICDAVCVYFA